MQKALSYVLFDGDLYKRNTRSSKMYGKEKVFQINGQTTYFRQLKLWPGCSIAAFGN